MDLKLRLRIEPLTYPGWTPATNASGEAWICVRENSHSANNASLPYYLGNVGGIYKPFTNAMFQQFMPKCNAKLF